MLPTIHRFVEAHDRYLALECARTDCRNATEREILHIEIMKAYLHVHLLVQELNGIQYADGMDYADMH